MIDLKLLRAGQGTREPGRPAVTEDKVEELRSLDEQRRMALRGFELRAERSQSGCAVQMRPAPPGHRFALAMYSEDLLPIATITRAIVTSASLASFNDPVTDSTGM